MRAFILRRLELIAGGYGDAVVIGSTHCGGTLGVMPWRRGAAESEQPADRRLSGVQRRD